MNYTLGIDLGTASLGWAVLRLDPKSRQPIGIERAGVRIFEAGVEGDIEQGRDSSRAAQRREARQPRRQNWRTQNRKRKLFGLLQQLHLLPESTDTKSEPRKQVLDQLDAVFTTKFVRSGNHADNQKLPYLLRTAALEERLAAFELGRVLYSLAMRRGFLSNRKGFDDAEEEGKVKAGISELAAQMAGRTLAQFFVDEVDPQQANPRLQRIRQRYTDRKMYHDEFRRIQAVQAAHFPEVSEDQWNQLFQAIFFQRPLKSQRQRIGKCEIDGKPRCPDALDVFQQFRILQTVSNLQVVFLDRSTRPLNDAEQKAIVAALQNTAILTWAKVKKLLNFPTGTAFSIEEWTPKGIIGHKTNGQMIDVFGDRWLQMSVDERDRITLEVLYYRGPSALVRRGREAWNLTEVEANLLKSVRLEEAHARHSRSTLRNVVEGMQAGKAYSTIRQELTGRNESDVHDILPPVAKSGLEITNPAVIRALTELRKVVNELVREYGKPTFIRIEMARDLKNSRDRRAKIHRDNEDNRKRRERAVVKLLEARPNFRYSGPDIEKWLLADECNWQCPYTGKQISVSTLLGATPQFDIEHIYPRQYLDNSFTNKTLCDVQFNRHEKRGQTAFDACSQRSDWEVIQQRVQSFNSPFAAQKLKRFLTAEISDDFTSRHLNDTRYNAVVAKKFMELLYGGSSDIDGNLRVSAPTGGLTATLRREWQLNSILSEDDEKNRSDHRHHAIDAIVIALTDQSRVQTLQTAAAEAARVRNKRFYKAIQEPWSDFLESARSAIEAVVVSHRVTRTLAGPLHAESIYSKAHTNADGKPQHRIRKELHKLTVDDIQKGKIADPKIREIVRAKFEALGGGNPTKVFSPVENHPSLQTKSGLSIPIHKVRINVVANPRSIGKGPAERFVASGKDSNYAALIYAIVDSSGKEVRWEHDVISRLEAHERLNANRSSVGEKVLTPGENEPRSLKMVIRKNDCLILDGPEGGRMLYRVQSFGAGEIQLCPLNHLGLRGKDRSKFDQIQATDNMRKRQCVSVAVSPAGIISQP